MSESKESVFDRIRRQKEEAAQAVEEMSVQAEAESVEEIREVVEAAAVVEEPVRKKRGRKPGTPGDQRNNIGWEIEELRKRMGGGVVGDELINGYQRKVLFSERSLYEEEFCEMVIKFMAEGRTLKDAATMCGIKWRTFAEWIEEGNERYIPQLAEAVEFGKQLSELWWNETARLNLSNKNFNATLFMMNMSNRFGWTRRIDGNVELKKVTEDRKVLEIKIEERSEEHVAEVLRILSESGAIQPRIEDHTEADTH